MEKKASRKRTKHLETWQSTKRSKAALRGAEHTTKSGKKIIAKAIKSGCAPCRKNCTAIISEDTRKQIFKEYWSEGKNWDIKRQFICSHVESKPTERRRPKDNRRNSKKQTINYFLRYILKSQLKKFTYVKLIF